MALLDYRPPQSGNSGYAALAPHAVMGGTISLASILAAYVIGSTETAKGHGIVVLILCLAAGMIVAGFLTFPRRPGFLVGFLIVTSMLGLFFSLCGIAGFR
jgi:hypothetical protein